MRFVMTGHRGLIGSSLLQRLVDRGDAAADLIDSREGGDILKINDRKDAGQVDMMIHLASFCKINKIVKEPRLSFRNNVAGTEEVLEYCRERNIPKIVFTSTSRILSPEKNPYTAGKIYGEELCRGYSGAYGIDHVIIRPSTVYGPFNDKTKRLTDIFIINALTGKPLIINGDKNKTLDFTYVDDFVDATLLAIEQKNESYDVSGGEEVNVTDLANYIIKLNGGAGSIIYEPAEVAQPQKVKLDISKIRSLGYEPKVSLEDGIRRCYDWYKKNLSEVLSTRDENLLMNAA